jgi:imidazoleglycerol-phosphate dehydratase
VPETQTGVRMALAAEGSANVTTGLPVLDHLIGELARTGRFRLSLEVAPGRADEAVASAGRAVGRALGDLLSAPGANGWGWALVPSAEALAAASLERDAKPQLISNVEFSHQRVGGLADDVASVFLREAADAAQINLHVRLLEGTDPQHVLTAIYKAVGAALGQACRPVTTPDEEGS